MRWDGVHGTDRGSYLICHSKHTSLLWKGGKSYHAFTPWGINISLQFLEHFISMQLWIVFAINKQLFFCISIQILCRRLQISMPNITVDSSFLLNTFLNWPYLYLILCYIVQHFHWVLGRPELQPTSPKLCLSVNCCNDSEYQSY